MTKPSGTPAAARARFDAPHSPLHSKTRVNAVGIEPPMRSVRGDNLFAHERMRALVASSDPAAAPA
jgi:hypothetical protein